MDTLKIGTYIAAKRKELGLTQKQLAEMLGVTDKTVSRWETGKYMPDMSLLIPLSEKLGISVFELLNGQDNEEDRAHPEKDREKVKATVRYMRKTQSGKYSEYLRKIFIASIPFIVSYFIIISPLYGYNVMLEIYHRLLLQFYWLVIAVFCLYKLFKTGHKDYVIYLVAAVIGEFSWLGVNGRFQGFLLERIKEYPVFEVGENILLLFMFIMLLLWLLYRTVLSMKNRSWKTLLLIFCAVMVLVTGIYLFTTPEGAVRAYYLSHGHLIAAFKKVKFYEINGMTRAHSVKVYMAVFHGVVESGDLDIVRMGILVFAKYYGFG